VNPNFLACTAGAALLLVLDTLAWAQPVLDGTETIDFDRPEAWAMKRSASLTLFTPLGPPKAREPANVFGCEAPSADEVSLNYGGVGLTGGYLFPGKADSAVHFGAFATYMDLEFQVNALTYGVRDQTTLLTDGWTYALTAGFSWALGTPTRLAVEAFYSPLEVDRPLRNGESTVIESRNDGLLNVRAMFSYVF
jgi:hypothetical protein